ncbi:MAG: RluA family pseudouridine synthase, partial [Nitrospinae bacterium]|nr:RluA family pseudouridine synthase [Nitrospinota bacterium]
GGEEVRVKIPNGGETGLLGEDIPIDIVYEDDYIIVVNKPHGMVVHPAAGNQQGTLVNALLNYTPYLAKESGSDRPGIVHRLDKDTSGLMVVAKDDESYRSLSRQLKERSVKKTYLAVVVGKFKDSTGEINLPIGRHSAKRKIMSVHSDRGREAITLYRVVEELPTGHSLLEVDLQTGRTHQIRVHLASLNRPVVGDLVYGPKKVKRNLIDRQALHAAKIQFTHPHTGERLSFEAPLPDDMRLLLDTLRGKAENI